MNERQLDTGEVMLNYAEAGDAANPPLVLLHGGSARWQWLTPVIGALADRWHVYAPDLRGHGRSSHTPWRYTDAEFAADIGALLRLIERPAALVGHSLGGRIAAVAAAEYGEHVRALVIGDAPLWMETMREHHMQNEAALRAWAELAGRPADEIAERLKDTPVIWGDEPNPRLAREALGEDAAWFGLMADSLTTHDRTMLLSRLTTEETYGAFVPETLLPRIACPTLLLQGDPAKGGLLGDDEAARTCALLPDGRRVRFDGIGHGLFMDDRDVVLVVVEDFLTGPHPPAPSPMTWRGGGAPGDVDTGGTR